MEIKKIPDLRFSEFDEEWQFYSLESVADIYDGTHQTPKYVESGVPFVSVENINDIEKTDKFITEEAFEKFKIKPKKNDILMTRITAGIIGATSIVKNDNPLGYYVSLALIRRKDDSLDVDFLEHQINSPYFKRELHRRIIHIAFPKKINLGEIGLCKIKLPEPEEQTKIASFLAAIDKRITLLKSKKDELEKYKKGITQIIFNQDIRFKDENEVDFPNWKTKRLGDIADVYQPKTISQSDLTDEGYLVYGANGVIGRYGKYNHENSQIAVTCRGNTCGTVNWTEPFSWITGNAMVINLDNNENVVKKYLYYLLSYTNLSYLITGSGQPQITGDIKNHKILIPVKKEQEKISDFLETLDKSINVLRLQVENTVSFKNGLLQKMFI